MYDNDQNYGWKSYDNQSYDNRQYGGDPYGRRPQPEEMPPKKKKGGILKKSSPDYSGCPSLWHCLRGDHGGGQCGCIQIHGKQRGCIG